MLDVDKKGKLVLAQNQDEIKMPRTMDLKTTPKISSSKDLFNS